MNLNCAKFVVAFFLLFSVLFSAQSINLNSLEQEIIQNNRLGNYKLSQKKLSDILLNVDLTTEERAHIVFFMAATYRSVGDYTMCIYNLGRCKTLAEELPADHRLKMRIDYEYAFVYFDNKDFQKSREVMNHIALQNYKNPFPEDQSYILMQEGFLFQNEKKFEEAEVKYNEALKIMKTASPCNLPTVFVKMMTLQGKRKNVEKAEQIYEKSRALSDRCNILKYKIFAASEVERIYKENNLFGKAYLIGSELDSLRGLENIESTVSEMHLADKAYTRKGVFIKEESEHWKNNIFLIFTILIACGIVFYYYQKTSKIKIDKLKMMQELEEMKLEIDAFSDTQTKFYNGEKQFFLSSDELTNRQKELLIHMADGLSNRQIAEKLFISESTVKYHIKNIYGILNIKDRKDFFRRLSQNS